MGYMEIIVIILSILLLGIGLLGSVFPGVPGPPAVYIALLILHFFTEYTFSNKFLIIWGCIVIFITVAENLMQVYGVKVFGGDKKAIIGSVIGFLIGLFLPIPFGSIIGMFIGALIGAIIETKNNFEKAVKIALGSIIGFIASVFLKITLSCFLVYEFLKLFIEI